MSDQDETEKALKELQDVFNQLREVFDPNNKCDSAIVPKDLFQKYNATVARLFPQFLGEGALMSAVSLQPFMLYFWRTKQIYWLAETLKALAHLPTNQKNDEVTKQEKRVRDRLNSYFSMLNQSYEWANSHEGLDPNAVYDAMIDGMVKSNGLRRNDVEVVQFDIFNDNHSHRRAFFMAIYQRSTAPEENPSGTLYIDILFTGTDSLGVWTGTNVLVYPAETESGTRCHAGIARMYDGLKGPLIKAIRQAMLHSTYANINNLEIDKIRVEMQLTGHSLGGALAMLFGYEVGWQLRDILNGNPLKQIVDYEKVMAVKDMQDHIVVAATSGPAIFKSQVSAAPSTVITNFYHKNDRVVNWSRWMFNFVGFDAAYGPSLPTFDIKRAHDFSKLPNWINMRSGFHNFDPPVSWNVTNPWKSTDAKLSLSKVTVTGIGIITLIAGYQYFRRFKMI